MAEELDAVVTRLRELSGDVPVDWTRPRRNRVYVTLDKEDGPGFGRSLFEEFGARFATATGTDLGAQLEVVYHFVYDAVGLVVNMRVRTPKTDPVLPAVTPAVPAAEWIEREIQDLLGVRFEGHPDPRRLILADDWPEGVHPLRREDRDDE